MSFTPSVLFLLEYFTKTVGIKKIVEVINLSRMCVIITKISLVYNVFNIVFLYFKTN